MVLGVLLLCGCATTSQQAPVKTRTVKLGDTRHHIESVVKDPARRAELLRLTDRLAVEVENLNDFDAQHLSRMAVLSADYDASESAIRNVGRSFRRGRDPLQRRMVDTVFKMKASAEPGEWQSLCRIAFTEATDSMVIKRIQPES